MLKMFENNIYNYKATLYIVALIGYNSAMRVIIIKIVHVCERIIIYYGIAKTVVNQKLLQNINVG